MARKRKKPSWFVMVHGFGDNGLKWVDVFELCSMERSITWLKKKISAHKRKKLPIDSKFLAEMGEELRRELAYNYWSKCEYEILVGSCPPSYDVDSAVKRCDEVACENPDWHNSRAAVMSVLDHGSKLTKIDVYDQIMPNFEHFKAQVFEYLGLTVEK